MANTGIPYSCSSLSELYGDKCSEYTRGPLGDAFGAIQVFVLLAREGGFPNGVGGLQFGIEYDESVRVLGWSQCSGGAEIPSDDWPASGSGNALTWRQGCHEPMGEVAIAGLLVVEAPLDGELRIIADPRVGMTLWADCSAELAEICPGNGDTFNLDEPAVPICGDQCDDTVPVHEASWSAIKDRFGDHAP